MVRVSSFVTRWAELGDERRVSFPIHVPPPVAAARLRERRVVIAEAGGHVVGTLHLEYLWGTQPYVAWVRVAETHRRRGIGRALVGFLEAEMRREGHGQLLSSSQRNEPEPQAWHRQLGFSECGAISGLNRDGSDEVFFRKSL